MSKLRKAWDEAVGSGKSYIEFPPVMEVLIDEIEALNRKFDTWTGKYDEMDAIDKGQQIADQNNERFGKKQTLTREQVEEILEKASGMSNTSRGAYAGDEEIPITWLKTMLESFIEKEYKCPCCGTITGHTHPCYWFNFTADQRKFGNWACYQDDWNGSMV